jgi:hypothetical protein
LSFWVDLNMKEEMPLRAHARGGEGGGTERLELVRRNDEPGLFFQFSCRAFEKPHTGLLGLLDQARR